MEVSIGRQKGTSKGKNPNVILIKVADLETDASGEYTGFPGRAANKVASNSNITLKANAKALAVYIEPSTINRWDASDGDGVYAGHISNFTGEHPGDSEESAQFLQEYLGEPLLILSRECAEATGNRLLGTPCNPMMISYEGQDNNEGVKQALTFVQLQRDEYRIMHYKGTTPALLPYVVDDSGESGI